MKLFCSFHPHISQGSRAQGSRFIQSSPLRATLAEKEVNTLKEQLSSSSPSKVITQNGGITGSCQQPPQSTSPTLSECGSVTNLSSKLNVKSELDLTGEVKMEPSGGAEAANSRTTPGPCDKQPPEGQPATPTANPASTDSNHSTTSGNGRTLAEDLAAKDKEIAALVEEVARLRSAIAALQESHAAQIQRLEDRLEQKRQQITRLEARLDKQSDYEDVKKENSLLRSVDLSTSDSKQFQELLQERTKALAAHSEALKSASADGSASGVATPFSHNSLQPGAKFPSSSSSSSPCTPAHTPTSTPISLPASHPTPPATGKLSANGAPPNPLLPPPFANVETFGSFLGEEIVSNWRRGLDLPPPPPHHALAALRPSMLAPMNHQTSRSPSTDAHTLSHEEKPTSVRDHDASSTASSTPVLGGTEEAINGAVPHAKSPAEDNNNTLAPLTHTHPMLQGLPFQFQERGHFRFAEDLQLPPGSMVGRLGDSLIPKGDPMEAKLQEMLRYNMDKYANQNLDTLHISRRVRELLSVHNIGQRLFAKYVLGLSQGTVSELLSKPKPWDKLTEKGRDSYRKMHAWGCDDNAVLLLKSLIPKKAPQTTHADAHPSDLPPHPPFPIEFRRKDSAMPPYGRPEDSMTDERIAHILNEASNLMKPGPGHHPPGMNQHPPMGQQQEDTRSNDDSKSPHNQCTSPFSKDSSQNRRLKKYENDDIPQEKVARIYHEELTKLMKVAPRDGFSRYSSHPRRLPIDQDIPGEMSSYTNSYSFLFPHFFSGGMPPMNQIQDESLRMTFEAYQRELVKLQQSGANLPNFPNIPNLPSLLALQQHALNGAQDLSLPKEKQLKMNGQQQNTEAGGEKDSEDVRHSGSAFSLVRPKQETSSTPTTTASSAPSPLSNSILPPAITPTEDFSAAASPLQRMASITNSLITQPPVTPHHSSPQRPLKAVLPPITQQQFDMFNNLNTEDIVRRVKEALSQYSISQRLFGESVLGLSQGSVSDLLARPKPWHMLTQKGREPFIRMKMFLEDENAVHKLVASQYKIAPEKLMRTGSYSGSPQIPPQLAGGKMPPMPKLLNDQITKMQQDQQQHLMQQMQGSPMQSSQPQPPTSTPQGMLLTPPGLPPHHAIPLAAAQAAAAAAAAAQEKKQMPMPVHSPQQNNAMRGMHQHMSPTVYEMAALTQDLDTQVITTKIKEALLANNIGQKIFGEAVLGLSQGSVSELLSKPKPWHMLSIKGREPFIRMQLWLSDANNVDRLQALKNERREANKRRRSTGPGAQDNSSDTSSNDTSEFYHSNSPGPGSVGSVGAPPSKKQRVLFSEEQKEALRLAFALDPYPNVATIEFLATELGLSTRTITNWFHNHRMRLKQQVPHGAPSEPPVPPRESQSGAPFDPVHFRILLNQRLMELQKERMGLSGVPLQYTPYFATNPNLAALISRGLLPGAGDADLTALNTAFKEQMSGLDLSLKREGDDDFDDVDGEADSHVSDGDSVDESKSEETKETPVAIQASARSSRRKPAAPQWVNPDWQDDKKPPSAAGGASTREEEVIINGVCVMQQAADYSRTAGEETVHVEPQAVAERFEEPDEDEPEAEGDDEAAARASPAVSEKAPTDHPAAAASPDSTDDTENGQTDVKAEAVSPIKKEVDDDGDRWEY
ncbi:homeobox protein cut isoform X3 [Lutzomyia longipalpis]|uniref:homeobox protein cut isoform X3 n=1 Tax=Lutzomyia longipalpis TaxID=7200 RepID=UPI00248370C8|nr:homeobox protein cut isoform X3 [Lutzomyia longipalpis]